MFGTTMKVEVYNYIAEHGAGLLFRPVEGSNPRLLSDLEPQLAFIGEYDLPDAMLKAIGEDDIHPGCYGAIYVEK